MKNKSLLVVTGILLAFMHVACGIEITWPPEKNGGSGTIYGLEYSKSLTVSGTTQYLLAITDIDNAYNKAKSTLDIKFGNKSERVDDFFHGSSMTVHTPSCVILETCTYKDGTNSCRLTKKVNGSTTGVEWDTD